MTHRFSPRTAVAIALAAVLANTTLALPARADGGLDNIRPTPPRAAPATGPATDQFIVGIQGGPGIASEAAATFQAPGIRMPAVRSHRFHWAGYPGSLGASAPLGTSEAGYILMSGSA